MSLAQYKQIRKIGKGSYGQVTLARHRDDKKKYVLKQQAITDAPEREKQCALQEAELMAKLKHPNVVSYRESFIEKGHLYIAMGFCEGGDLYHELRSRKGVLIEEDGVMEWVIQIALGLQYLHEHNILHRDLKTQNIFLTKNRIVKVGDLGIAKVLESQSDMATTMIGTPYYMSPELFSNVPYNHKSDVWSFGCCCYEMATQKQAFNARDINALVYRVVRGKVARLPALYSDTLNDIVQSMLATDTDNRPTVDALLQMKYVQRHIERFLGNQAKKSSRRRSSRQVLAPAPTTATAGGDGPGGAASGDASIHTRPPAQLPTADSPAQKTTLGKTIRSPLATSPVATVSAGMLLTPAAAAPARSLGSTSKTPLMFDRAGAPTSELKTPSLAAAPPTRTGSSGQNARARRKWREQQKTPPTRIDVGLAEPTPIAAVGGPALDDGPALDLDLDDDSDDSGEDSDDLSACLGLMDTQLRSPRRHEETPPVPMAGVAETPIRTNRAIVIEESSPHTPPADAPAGNPVASSIKAMPPPSSAKLPVGGLKATPLTGVTKTPLRGPLVERAIALREMCIKVLGMPLFLRAIEVLSRHEEAEATAILLPEIGAERFEAMKGSLFQTVLCEQALQGLNEISLGLSTELPPVYMG